MVKNRVRSTKKKATAKKKSASKKTASSSKKSVSRKAARSRKPVAQSRAARKQKPVARARRGFPRRSKASPSSKSSTTKNKAPRDSGLNRQHAIPAREDDETQGPGSAGQSGDIQGLSATETSGPESVEELVEEGQDYEASVVDGVENAPEADQGEVRARHRRTDDDKPRP